MITDKCLLIVKPKEPFYEWVQALAREAKMGSSVTLELMQEDANCYVMPTLPPKETASYIESHTPEMFEHELNLWCKVKQVWPSVNFPTFASFCQFNFFYDWLDFRDLSAPKSEEDMKNIILLVKPKEKIKEYLREVLLNKFKVPPQEVDAKLDMNLILNGSTVVITDIEALDDIEYFMEHHYEEIFVHQLMLWGGEGSEAYWPSSNDIREFREYFSIEIHPHTYLLH